MEISKNLDENITVIKSKFDKWGDIVEKKFVLSRPGWSFEEAIYVVYIDGLCDHELIENTIIKPVTWGVERRRCRRAVGQDHILRGADCRLYY